MNKNSNVDPSSGTPVQITISSGLAAGVKRWFWIFVGGLLALWLAYLVREIWVPLAIAFIIAMVLDPVVDRMERRGWKRGTASGVIFAGFFVVFGTALYFAIPAVVKQVQTISGQVTEYIPMAAEDTRDAKKAQEKAQGKLHQLLQKAHAPAYVEDAVKRSTASLGQTLRRSTSWLAEHGMDILSNLIWIVIIPIVTFYALKDFHLIFAKSLLLVPREKRDFVQIMVAEVSTIFAKFLRGLMIVSLLNGLATWVLLVVLRTPNAFTLGAIAGVLYSVPYLGALTTIVLVAGVAFLHGGIQYMLLVIALNVLLHQIIFDQIITPRILGGHVGLHPILSIIALLVGNVLLGILGMILAVPVAASIQMVVLTLVPKLNHEIAISPDIHSPPDTVESLSEETKTQQATADATAELHRTVSQVVEDIEAKAEAQRLENAESETGADAAAVEETAVEAMSGTGAAAGVRLEDIAVPE